MQALSASDLSGYRRDGYLFPLQVLDVESAQRCRNQLETVEAKVEEDPQLGGGKLRASPHFVLPFLDSLIRDPAITAPVAAILGEDLLVWGCTLFIKEPRTSDYVGWHQDLHYWGLDAEDEVTAWLALTPAGVENGCMRFLPGSHHKRAAHIDHDDAHAMLTRGQEVAVEVDEAEAVNVVLSPGQISLHHGRTFHASHPNRSGERRIGVAIRYISPKMKQETGDKAVATLVRGSDPYGHFELFAGPRGVMTHADLALRRRALAISSQINYRDADPAIAARA